jgi:hypothetical protein
MCRDVEWLIKFYDSKLKEMEKAVDLASNLMKERMDGFPEQYVKKGETSEEFSRMRGDLAALTRFMNQAEGLASRQSVDSVRWLAIGGLIVSIVGLTLRMLGIGK